MMPIGQAARDLCGSRVGASLMNSDDLCDQWEIMVSWASRAPADVVEGKFSLEVAWLRELNWELRRRGLLEVH